MSAPHLSKTVPADGATSKPIPSLMLLAGYGLVLGLYSIVHLMDTLPPQLSMEGLRLEQAAQAIDARNRGAPALVGYANGKFFPTAISDDFGFNVYASWLGHTFGFGDPLLALRWAYITCFAILVCALPLVFFGVFRSLVVALTIPTVATIAFSFWANSDIYWMTGWVLALGLPLILLVHARRWSRWSVAGLVALMLLASFANSVRANAGLPLLLSALVVVVLRQVGWLRRVGIAALLLGAYLLVSPLAFVPLTNARDHYLHQNLTAIYPSSHAVWHSAFIGLGYIPNRFGIYWLDEVGFHKAHHVDPNVLIDSRHYLSIMRGLYFHMLVAHPGFVLHGYLVKARIVLLDSYTHWKGILVLLPLMLAVGPRRRQLRTQALILLPAPLVTAVAPVMTIPSTTYALGFRTSVGLYWLLGLAWLVLFVTEDVVAWAWSRDPATGERTMPRSDHAAAAAVRSALSGRRWIAPAVAAVFALLIVAEPVPASAVAVNPATAAQAGIVPTWKAPAGLGRLATSAPGAAVAGWAFGRGLPGGWSALDGTGVHTTAHGSAVDTSPAGMRTSCRGPSSRSRRGDTRRPPAASSSAAGSSSACSTSAPTTGSARAITGGGRISGAA